MQRRPRCPRLHGQPSSARPPSATGEGSAAILPGYFSPSVPLPSGRAAFSLLVAAAFSAAASPRPNVLWNSRRPWPIWTRCIANCKPCPCRHGTLPALGSETDLRTRRYVRSSHSRWHQWPSAFGRVQLECPFQRHVWVLNREPVALDNQAKALQDFLGCEVAARDYEAAPCWIPSRRCADGSLRHSHRRLLGGRGSRGAKQLAAQPDFRHAGTGYLMEQA